ncbi:MAG: lipid-A-disaccharide synthase [Gammaproteobacteria bacterium]|nr:lipid-A-disaccharide synthase [Gammaproteobacteria bacterium]
MRVVITAGEASGDQLGAGLIHAIKARRPDAVFQGIAGPRMQAAGCESFYPMERLSVMGLFEAFGRFVEVIPMRRRLARRLIADPPDVLVGIDAPDFNLSLELMLKQAGIPTVHYVSPSVWAWRRYRLKKIARAVDRMLVLFPFERDFYQRLSIPVSFVGHPMADDIPMQTDRIAARRALGLPEEGECVALLPGSRVSEVRFLAEPLVQTAVWLEQRRPGLRFVTPLADAATRALFEAAISRYAAHLELHLVDGRARDAMAAADAVLAASGTATLEALLLKRPMVITYRTLPLTWFIGRRMLHVDHVGLPNLLAGTELVPELLQGEAVAERLGPALLQFLQSPEKVKALQRRFDEIHSSLKNDASAKAAKAVLEVAAGGTK